MRYDAAIIGAGADGLAAATTLARAGLKVIVLERSEQIGGRCITREFHPGFRASPFCDELPPIPPEIFWRLGLAHHGAMFLPTSAKTGLGIGARAIANDALIRAAAGIEAASKPAWAFRLRRHAQPMRPWPGDAWATLSLNDLLDRGLLGEDESSLIRAEALCGRAADPALKGSALHLIAPGLGGSGQVAGGLHRLSEALMSVAAAAGAEISCGLEVTDIRHHRRKVRGLRLADGSEIEARAIISTLDLKRTFLSLFAWSGLPAEISKSVAAFRMAGSTARLLVALDRLPDAAEHAARGFFSQPIHLGFGADHLSRSYSAWRSGALAETMPITLRFVSAVDPRLAPVDMACATATVGSVPHRLFDGAWTHEKRDQLRQRVFASIEGVFPGFGQHVLACELLVPGDIEEQLGATDGDLWGGEIAADQMLAYRPFPASSTSAPRSPFAGLYLAGGSTAAGVLGTCVSGTIAADAAIADLKSGALR